MYEPDFWNPFREVDSISRDMETFFERSPFGFFSRATAPRVDVFRNRKDVVVRLKYRVYPKKI